jgi:hypothetical protein
MQVGSKVGETVYTLALNEAEALALYHSMSPNEYCTTMDEIQLGQRIHNEIERELSENGII